MDFTTTYEKGFILDFEGMKKKGSAFRIRGTMQRCTG